MSKERQDHGNGAEKPKEIISEKKPEVLGKRGSRQFGARVPQKKPKNTSGNNESSPQGVGDSHDEQSSTTTSAEGTSGDMARVGSKRQRPKQPVAGPQKKQKNESRGNQPEEPNSLSNSTSRTGITPAIKRINAFWNGITYLHEYGSSSLPEGSITKINHFAERTESFINDLLRTDSDKRSFFAAWGQATRNKQSKEQHKKKERNALEEAAKKELKALKEAVNESREKLTSLELGNSGYAYAPISSFYTSNNKGDGYAFQAMTPMKPRVPKNSGTDTISMETELNVFLHLESLGRSVIDLNITSFHVILRPQSHHKIRQVDTDVLKGIIKILLFNNPRIKNFGLQQHRVGKSTALNDILKAYFAVIAEANEKEQQLNLESINIDVMLFASFSKDQLQSLAKIFQSNTINYLGLHSKENRYNDAKKEEDLLLLQLTKFLSFYVDMSQNKKIEIFLNKCTFDSAIDRQLNAENFSLNQFFRKSQWVTSDLQQICITHKEYMAYSNLDYISTKYLSNVEKSMVNYMDSMLRYHPKNRLHTKSKEIRLTPVSLPRLMVFRDIKHPLFQLKSLKFCMNVDNWYDEEYTSIIEYDRLLAFFEDFNGRIIFFINPLKFFSKGVDEGYNYDVDFIIKQLHFMVDIINIAPKATFSLFEPGPYKYKNDFPNDNAIKEFFYNLEKFLKKISPSILNAYKDLFSSSSKQEMPAKHGSNDQIIWIAESLHKLSLITKHRKKELVKSKYEYYSIKFFANLLKIIFSPQSCSSNETAIEGASEDSPDSRKEAPTKKLLVGPRYLFNYTLRQLAFLSYVNNVNPEKSGNFHYTLKLMYKLNKPQLVTSTPLQWRAKFLGIEQTQQTGYPFNYTLLQMAFLSYVNNVNPEKSGNFHHILKLMYELNQSQLETATPFQWRVKFFRMEHRRQQQQQEMEETNGSSETSTTSKSSPSNSR